MTHVYPINDLQEHELSSTCACYPRIEHSHNGEIICVHNSFDGREAVEMANDLLKGIDRSSTIAQEYQSVEFKDSRGNIKQGIVSMITYNPTQYMIDLGGGFFSTIDESDIIRVL